MSNKEYADAELDEDIRRAQEERLKRDSGMVSMASRGSFDSDIYGGGPAAFSSTAMDIDMGGDDDDSEDDVGYAPSSRGGSGVVSDIPPGDDADDVFAETRTRTIAEREEGTYQAGRKRTLKLSPARADMMALSTPALDARKPADAALEAKLSRQEAELRAKLAKQEEDKKSQKAKESSRDRRDRDRDRDRVRDKDERDRERDRDRDRDRGSRRDRDDRREDTDSASASESVTEKESKWDSAPSGSSTASRWDSTPSATASSSRKRSRWDSTPAQSGGSRWDATPARTPSRWDATPKGGSAAAATPRKEGSRWDETPQQVPAGMQTPGATPVGGAGLMTPMAGSMTPEQHIQMRLQADIDWRNRPLSDSELDEMLPPGYKKIDPPPSYKPIHTPARKLMATPTPMGGDFQMQEGQSVDPTMYGIRPSTGADDLPEIRQEDQVYFQKLIDVTDESTLTGDEAKEVKIMRLLLKFVAYPHLQIKNGTPPMRKVALRQITDRARDFGPASLFNHILPLLMSPTLEDQERHLLVKVIDRVLYKLDDLVRPYVHKILVVIMPLLIEEDYYARVEGREVISNLAKAAGLPTMIAVMRPDIDDQDEYVRNTTARAFAVVASALGVASLLPFLKVVCASKSSWQARHTGIKIVMQIAQLMGPATLPYLKSLVTIIEHGLKDQEHKVRTITALAIAALAEAAFPYGIESFDTVLKPLWYGINEHRGKGLAAFLKAIGYIIPLMDAEYASHYTIEVMRVLVREFRTPEDDMKKIVLKVVKQCVSTEGVEAKYIRQEILPPFCKNFWISRMAMDRRNYKALVETTVALAHKVGASEIISLIVEHLKADGESYRKMVCETIDKIITEVGAADIDTRLEELLIDGILYAFQEQVSEDARALLSCFGTIANSMGTRIKPYLPQVVRVIKWRLSSKQPKVREQAADLIAKIAPAMKTCQEDKLMGHLGVVLYEYLGEEYPDVLGSILGGLKAIINVIGMTKMTPPIKDLLPRLTPILKNRHEKVQENVIDLVGRIADRGHEFVSEREWMRICFELLESLKAHKKGIRRAAVNCFGYIAKAIGPQDVLATLLNNLRVADRTMRVCTTVAIAIVAETCEPYTVIPALMNEYRVPDLNVQNGCLKAFAFMFEYISELGKDYVYAVVPLLQDALMDRDAVHRQTAMAAVFHIGMGVNTLGCEDAMLHLLNFCWPNVFEVSPHVHNRFMLSIDGIRASLGVSYICQYLWSGMFHPARKVRGVFWKVYNACYVGSQDAMVPNYPTIPNEPNNCYYPAEMNMFI